MVTYNNVDDDNNKREVIFLNIDYDNIYKNLNSKKKTHNTTVKTYSAKHVE